MPSYPKPTVQQPALDDIIEMADEGYCETTDGVCSHGHPSWMIVLALI